VVSRTLTGRGWICQCCRRERKGGGKPPHSKKLAVLPVDTMHEKGLRIKRKTRDECIFEGTGGDRNRHFRVIRPSRVVRRAEARRLHFFGSRAEPCEAGFGGGEGGFFFAEGEADLGGAVAGVVIEAGAGDDGDADVLD
jgi:hypothetical protein